MADVNTGFIVYVEAEKVKGTGKKAIKGIEKEIYDESSKSKKLVVPVDISVNISDTDEKIKNAQAKVIKRLKEMTAEGFSASHDDIKNLKKDLASLGNAMDKAGIGRQNNIYSIINKQVKEIDKASEKAKKLAKIAKVKNTTSNDKKSAQNKKKLTKKEQEEQAKLLKEQQEKITQQDMKNYAKAEKKKRAEAKKAKLQELKDNEKYKDIGTGTITEAEIQGDIKRRKEATERHNNQLGSNPPPREIETSNAFDSVTVTRKSTVASKYGGAHPVRAESAAAKERKEQEKKSAKTLKIKKVDTATMEKALEDALNQAITEVSKKIVVKKGRGRSKKQQVDTELETRETTRKVKPNKQNAHDSYKMDAVAAAGLAAAELYKIKNDKEDANPELFQTLVKAIGEFTKQSGETEWKGIETGLNRIMAQFFDSSGQFAVAFNTPREGKNPEAANEALKGMVDHFADLTKDQKAFLDASELQLRRFLAANKDWKALEALDKPKTGKGDINNSHLMRAIREMTGLKGNKEVKSVGNQLKASMNVVSKNLKNVDAIGGKTKATLDTTLAQDKVEAVAERTADVKEQTIETENKDTGFNTNTKSDELISAINNIGKQLERLMDISESQRKGKKKDAEIEPNPKLLPSPYVKNEDTNKFEKTQVQNLDKEKPFIKFGLNEEEEKLKYQQALPKSTFDKMKELFEKIFQSTRNGKNESDSTSETGENGKVPRSEIKTTIKDPGVFSSIKDAFSGLTKTTANYREIMAKTSKEQDKLNAELVERYGIGKGGSLAEQGDKISIARRLSVFKGQDKFKDMFKDLDFSEGVHIDTTEITDKLAKVLSGSEMFKAQTGGWLNNLAIAGTGGIAALFQPSLEKTRAQADGVNQIMADIRAAMNQILQDILDKESALTGMEDSGALKFKEDGSYDLENSSPEANALVASLEESKLQLKQVLADVGMVDEVIGQSNGKITQIIQKLGFTAPMLRKDNMLLANLNAGLDKTGKALKFQNRAQEILNYSFQLMGRHIGQALKRLLLMLNPLSLIKRAFQDFASYDVKWQRTMNVIKYNIRRILKPFMQWLAQQIVNVIGLVNALLKGIGRVFGKNWDLFDQAAANTEKMEEDFEKMNNISASFDELHDISSETGENDPANDLLGDIYTPQWTGAYEWLEKIGEKIGKIFKAIKDFTKKYGFWGWLAIGGAALLGFILLKKLINWFKGGKNPLQSVADGFKTLEQTVGWAALIWSLGQFVKELKEFIDVVSGKDFWSVVGALGALAVGFGILAGAIYALEASTSHFKTTTGQLFGLSALVGVFDLFIKAIVPFIECVKDLGKEKLEVLVASILGLAGAFAVLVTAVSLLQKFSNKDLGMTKMLGLAALVYVFGSFTKALVPFIDCIKDLGKERVEVLVSAILGLAGAFVALAAGVGLISHWFKAMDWSSIGKLAVVVVVFTAFTYALIPFLKLVKDIPGDELLKKFGALALVFVALGGALALMGVGMKAFDVKAILGIVGGLLSLAAVLWVLTKFVEVTKDMAIEDFSAKLKGLAQTLGVLALGLIVLAAVFTGLVATGYGAIALVLLGLILAALSLVIRSLTEFVTALGEASDGICQVLEKVKEIIDTYINGTIEVFKTVGDILLQLITGIVTGVVMIILALATAISTVVTSVATAITTVVTGLATAVSTIATGLATAFTTILEPILTFLDDIITKICDLAATIVDKVGTTIKDIVKTVGDLIRGILQDILDAIPKLLKAITDFIKDIGPAIDKSVGSIMKTITKLVNFIVSAIEYMVNLAVDGINGLADSFEGLTQYVGIHIPRAHTVSLRRFVPKYENGTNYVPNNGLAYLHQGEAVVPKKYNTPYQPQQLSPEEKAYMQKMMVTMTSLEATMRQGIAVSGKFTQKGTDLVAVINKVKSKKGSKLVSSASYNR